MTESNLFEIRADFDSKSIVVYQAFKEEIALPAIKFQKFVEPFSFNRMTWIKPSFLWLMERSAWGQAKGQEYVLAVRIKRSGWEEALSKAVLTSPELSIYGSASAWEKKFKDADVHVQWDPERSLRGTKLNIRSIQVGLSSSILNAFVENWILEIKDLSPLVNKMRRLRQEGQWDSAKKFLPLEKPYLLPKEIYNSITPRKN